MSYLAALTMALLLSAMLTALYLRVARYRAWVDTPNHRSAHDEVTASSGGLAIGLAFAGCISLAAGYGGVAFGPLGGAFCAAALLCLLGAIDDRRPLPVSFRLFACVILSALALYPFLRIESTLDVVFALVGVVTLSWLVNLNNFMDGIDGIAATQCVVTALTMAVLAYFRSAEAGLVLVLLILAGTYLGFLGYNWPPARLFMGDAGSLPAGLMLGITGLWASRLDAALGLAWLVLMSPFILDTGFTLARRAAAGKRLTEGHSEHIYQRCNRRWGTLRVDLGLLALHLVWLIPLAFAAAFELLPSWTLAPVTLFPQLFLIAKWRRLQ
ncbi:MAG: glycosyltransferase family 4 protein [Pseudomonadota bacterium]